MNWRLKVQAVRLMTLPGPLISDASARAIVSRLESGIRWAADWLNNDSTFAGDVERVPLNVVDRWGLLEVLEHDLAEVGGVTAAQLRQLVLRIQWYWSPSLRRIFLVAPNAWSLAARLHLDEADFAKWIALEASLTVKILLSLEASDPEAFEKASALAAEKMRQIEPRDLASVYWLREHLVARDKPRIPGS